MDPAPHRAQMITVADDVQLEVLDFGGKGHPIVLLAGLRPAGRTPSPTVETVRMVGLALSDVEATTQYDGSPVLKVGGAFMAGLATHLFAPLDHQASAPLREFAIEFAGGATSPKRLR